MHANLQEQKDEKLVVKLLWCNYDSKSSLQALVSFAFVFMFTNLDIVNRHKENNILFPIIAHIGACIFALLLLLFSFSFLFQKGEKKREDTVEIGS